MAPPHFAAEAPPDQGSSGKVVQPVKQVLDLRHERLIGTVAQYFPANAYGFLTSHLFEGKLLFKAESFMPEFQGRVLTANEALEFDVQPDEHGRPQAVRLKPVVGVKPADCIGQRHRGYVRRFAERWGFLNAAAFDGDLFVHRDNLLLGPDQGLHGQPLLHAGQAVDFDVQLDDRGRVVACQIATRALLRPCDWVGHRLRGCMRSFQGVWGFINSDQFSGDLFMHRDSLVPHCQGAQIAVGSLVEFDIQRDQHKNNSKDRLVARNVAVLAGEAVAAAAYPAGAQMPCQQMDPAIAAAYRQASHYAPPYPQAQAAGCHGIVAGGCPAPVAGGVPSPVAVQGDGKQQQGLLHISMHDWEPDQLGQLWVTKGTLVNVTHRAAHGWVYAGTVQPGSAAGEPAMEGWLPEAVVKRVSLCRAGLDWPAEGPSTLSVTKGEIVAVSQESNRGWVYGERIGPMQPNRPADGWLPKKVLDYFQY